MNIFKYAGTVVVAAGLAFAGTGVASADQSEECARIFGANAPSICDQVLVYVPDQSVYYQDYYYAPVEPAAPAPVDVAPVVVDTAPVVDSAPVVVDSAPAVVDVAPVVADAAPVVVADVAVA